MYKISICFVCVSVCLCVCMFICPLSQMQKRKSFYKMKIKIAPFCASRMALFSYPIANGKGGNLNTNSKCTTEGALLLGRASVRVQSSLHLSLNYHITTRHSSSDFTMLSATNTTQKPTYMRFTFISVLHSTSYNVSWASWRRILNHLYFCVLYMMQATIQLGFLTDLIYRTAVPGHYIFPQLP